MRNSIEIGCPVGYSAWRILALKFFLLVCSSYLISGRLSAQCQLVRHPLGEYEIYSSCTGTSAAGDPFFIDFQVVGTNQVLEMALEFESDVSLPKIVSIGVEWIGMPATGLNVPEVNWTQGGNQKSLEVILKWPDCSPTNLSVFQFRFHVHTMVPVFEPWNIRRIDGGIVQVDLIQGKQTGMETQQIISLKGVMLREVVLPPGSSPATEGLAPGIYLLRRIPSAGQAIYCEKVLVL